MAKKICRSSVAKLLAFLMILGCIVGAAGTVGQMVGDVTTEDRSDPWVYQFESSFADSNYVSNLMNQQLVNLEYALIEQDGDRYLTDFPGDYYGCYGTTRKQNADLVMEDVLDSRFYIVVRPDGVESNIGLRFTSFFMEDGVFSASDGMAVRLTDAQAAPIEQRWNEQKAAAYDTVKAVLLLIVIALVLFLYLLFVTGRRPEDDEVHLVTIDRLFVECAVVLAGGAAVLGVGLYLTLLREITYNGDVTILLWPAIALLTACAALTLELILSLVRNLKNRSFVSRSFVLRACKWGWKQAVRLTKWLWSGLGRARRGIGAACRSFYEGVCKNYKTRNVVLVFLGYTVVLAVLAMMFGGMMDYGEGYFVLLLGGLWFGLAAAFLIKRVRGFETIVDGIRRLRAGELEHKIEALPAGVFSALADDLNSLGDGMQAALQNEVRAERMKSELITNVSHDLKTPLTSILTYADLLCKEQLSPEEANDYASIIRDKGLRLKNLTSDLFDISKVQAGAETILSERLDACTLVRQALAEQEQTLADSRLTIKTSLPEGEASIWADGKKMSRVLENLIGNCVKYAMPGTRVFLSVLQSEDTVAIELKNIAGYEMNFDAGEITERFVRGDAARSTEGSGLGLAIAKSYVEACGGTLAVSVDGDLFKVTIRFAAYR